MHDIPKLLDAWVGEAPAGRPRESVAFSAVGLAAHDHGRPTGFRPEGKPRAVVDRDKRVRLTQPGRERSGAAQRANGVLGKVLDLQIEVRFHHDPSEALNLAKLNPVLGSTGSLSGEQQRLSFINVEAHLASRRRDGDKTTVSGRLPLTVSERFTGLSTNPGPLAEPSRRLRAQ